MGARPADHPKNNDTWGASGAGEQDDDAEPTPGSDGDGPESGYTSPAELEEIATTSTPTSGKP